MLRSLIGSFLALKLQPRINFPASKVITHKLLTPYYSLSFKNRIQVWSFQSTIFNVPNKHTIFHLVFTFPKSKYNFVYFIYKSLTQFLKLVLLFGKCSGLIINYDKLEILLLGNSFPTPPNLTHTPFKELTIKNSVKMD